MERFTISLDDQLAEQFDAWRAGRKYLNRSEAIRDLLRSELGRAARDGSAKGECVGCLSYVYDHHQRDLAERLTHLQHVHHELTLSTMHAHLDHESCLETVLLRGPVAEVRGFADLISAERGVHYGNLNLISVEFHEPHVRHGVAGKSKARTAAKAGRHLHFKPAA